jgi:hypothetical protein
VKICAVKDVPYLGGGGVGCEFLHIIFIFLSWLGEVQYMDLHIFFILVFPCLVSQLSYITQPDAPSVDVCSGDHSPVYKLFSVFQFYVTLLLHLFYSR